MVVKDSALSPPTGFKAEIFDKGVNLSWNKSNISLVSGFNLYLADESGNPVKKLSAEPLTDNQVTLVKLKLDKTYRFILKALLRDGLEGPPTQVLEVQYANRTSKAPTNPALAPVTAHEESKPAPASPQGFCFLELAGGIDLPAQNWQSAYTSSPGGKISVGYEINRSLAIQLDVEGFYFSGTNYSGSITDTELLVLPTIQYSFCEQGIRPYLMAGVGVDFEFLSATPGSLVIENVDAAVGAGVEVQLTGRTYVFAEGKYNLIFFSEVTGQDVPILAGVRFGL